MKHRIYIGAATEQQARANAIGLGLITELDDAEIVSSWHLTEKAKYPLDPQQRASALAKNLSELERATVAVFLMDLGRPQTTFGEMGYALGRGIPVVMTKPEYSWQRTLFDAHACVTVLPVHRDLPRDLGWRIAAAIEAWASVESVVLRRAEAR